MSQRDLAFDKEASIVRLVRFLEVEGVTGQEKAIGREVMRALMTPMSASRCRPKSATSSSPYQARGPVQRGCS
jgi:hypothetical protein